jgi:hypothetical protein
MRRTVCCGDRSICRNLLSASLDLAESLPVTQIAGEVYASEILVILNHSRTIKTIETRHAETQL